MNTDKTYWKRWAKAAVIRALRTFGQAGVAAIPVSAIVYQIDWKMILGIAATSAVLSIFTSLSGLPDVEVE